MMANLAFLLVAALAVPNVYKLTTVSAQLVALMPQYLRWLSQTPDALADEATREHVAGNFFTIFFALQTHAVNGAACILLAWILWQSEVPDFPGILRRVILSVACAGVFMNVTIAWALGRDLRYSRQTMRELEELRLELRLPPSQKGSRPPSNIVLDLVPSGMYAASATACGCLAYVVGTR